MINRFWLILFAMLLLSGCGWDGTPTRPNDFTPLTSITISADYSTIASGTSTKLIATGHFSGQFSRDVTDQAVWSSASPTVADFNPTNPPNRVSSVSPGTAVITATVEGVTSAPYTLTVSNATIKTMTISPATPDPLPKGRSLQFTVQGEFSDLSTQDMTFDAAWTSSDVPVATVSVDNNSKGLAKAEAAAGSATISAVFPRAGGVDSKTGTKLLTVTAPVLDSITVTPSNSSIAGISKTQQFKATGNYSDGPKDITTTAAWKSSVEGVATIDATSGIATTKGAGTTTISATLDDISGNTTLTQTLKTLSITPTTPSVMIVGGNQLLSAIVTFNSGSIENVTTGCVWSTSASNIASVGSTTGLVTGVAIGQSTITATYNGLSATVTVTIQ